MTFKKCLVLDLDNVLWGGVVGEDGMDGIALGMQPPGSGFLAFQQAILDLTSRGVLLAINSKNNRDDALAVIRHHPNMLLREKHFAAMRMNWNSKVDNMRELSRELNIGLDAMVFLDDDPINRLLVKGTLPEVAVPDFPEHPELYARFLMRLPYFPDAAVTDEDAMRGAFYVTERIRKEAEKRFASPDDFLAHLGIEVLFFENRYEHIPRLAQLTAKTNQFNVKKRAMDEETIRRFMADGECRVFSASARDTFGDHGVIAFALVRRNEADWVIESLLMSCRVLGKGIEEAFLEGMRVRAEADGAATLHVVFEETPKNTPAKNFVEKYFFNGRLAVDRTPIVPAWVTLQTYG